jgi:WD40 repeat protein
MAFSPDSQYLACGDRKGNVFFWTRAQPWKPVEDYPHSAPVRWLAFVPGSRPRRLVTLKDSGTGTSAYLWTQTAHQPLHRRITPEGTPLMVTAVAVSPSGDKLALAGPQGTRLISLGDSTASNDLITVTTEPTTSVAFSADGQFLAAGADRAVLLFRLDHLSTPQRFDLGTQVNAVALSANGRYAAAASNTGTVVTLLTPEGGGLPLAGDQVAAFACSQTQRAALTAQDWTRYFGSEPIHFTCGQLGTVGTNGQGVSEGP